MQSHARFIAVDPSKRHRKDHKVTRLQCQTCFTSFDTHQGLRDHIADFQMEVQQLTARLFEAQAHLPRKHHSPVSERCKCHKEPASDFPDIDYKVDDDDSECGTGDDNGDDGDLDNDGNDTEERSEDDSVDRDEDKSSYRSTFYSTLDVHPSMQCPYPRCHRKAHFKTRAGLERHYESHVRCHEICVFCRQTFKSTRKFIRHTCRARRKGNNEAKEFYRRERCAQLKRYSAKTLSRTLENGKDRTGQTNKRSVELVGAADLSSCKAGDVCFTKSRSSRIIEASRARTIITTPYPLPLEKLPAKFECPYCLQTQEIKTPSDWRDHIRADMQVFTCTFPGCTSVLRDRKTWFRHVKEIHHQPERRWKCTHPGCDYISDKVATIYRHLTSLHMVEITPDVQVDIKRNHRHIKDNDAKGPCCFCDDSHSWRCLRDHLMKHLENITSLLLEPDERASG